MDFLAPSCYHSLGNRVRGDRKIALDQIDSGNAFVAFEGVQKSYDGEQLVVKDLNLFIKLFRLRIESNPAQDPIESFLVQKAIALYCNLAKQDTTQKEEHEEPRDLN